MRFRRGSRRARTRTSVPVRERPDESEWFGLLYVREIHRHYSNGRGEEGKTNLHRMTLVQEALDRDVHEVIPTVLKQQLGRLITQRVGGPASRLCRGQARCP